MIINFRQKDNKIWNRIVNLYGHVPVNVGLLMYEAAAGTNCNEIELERIYKFIQIWE